MSEEKEVGKWALCIGCNLVCMGMYMILGFGAPVFAFLSGVFVGLSFKYAS
jgi:type III secretory pathway component EscV